MALMGSSVSLLACGGDGDDAGADDAEGIGTDDSSGDGDGDGDGGGTTCDDPPTGTRCVPGGAYTPSSGVEVVVPTLLVDRTEVTVSDYLACVDDGACAPTGDLATCNTSVGGRETHPVNCVDFSDAQAYCAWRGRRLPTEWEWEWAARGREEARTFPWGEEVPGNRACWERAEPKPASTCVAGSRSPDGDSRDGLVDMAGNVWEWTDSWYDDTQSSRTVRGASWVDGFESRLRAENRLFNNPDARTIDLGFRCVVEEMP